MALAGSSVIWLTASVSPSWATTSSASRSASVVVPPGVTAGIAVFDRQTGQFTELVNPDLRFRSASVVKLLLALDVPVEPRPGVRRPGGGPGPARSHAAQQ